MTTTLTVRYIGPWRSIDVDGHPRSIPHGEPVEVAEALAQGLVARDDFEPVGWEPEVPEVPEHLDEVPDGPADAIAEWVGGDPIRREIAKAAELARAKPRKTVLNKLEQPLDTTKEH